MNSDRCQKERTHSFLVRVWREPREGANGPEPVRILMRDLKTGRESYLSEPGEIVEYLIRETPSDEVAGSTLDAAAG